MVEFTEAVGVISIDIKDFFNLLRKNYKLDSMMKSSTSMTVERILVCNEKIEIEILFTYANDTIKENITISMFEDSISNWLHEQYIKHIVDMSIFIRSMEVEDSKIHIKYELSDAYALGADH